MYLRWGVFNAFKFLDLVVMTETRHTGRTERQYYVLTEKLINSSKFHQQPII